jgi:hypothetical protein
MAAGILSKPGTEYGPCASPCKHIDCAKSREQAASHCALCSTPIGYDRRFYLETVGLVHADCLEDSIEAVEVKRETGTWSVRTLTAEKK